MFKNKTTVLLLVFTGCFASGAWAQDSSAGRGMSDRQVQLIEQACSGLHPNDERAKFQCILDRSSGGGSNNACTEAVKAFHEAQSTFSTACSEANMKSSAAAGSYACSAQVLACKFCDAFDESEDTTEYSSYQCKSFEEDGDDDSVTLNDATQRLVDASQGRFNNGQRRNVTPNIGSSRTKFKNCPALAGEDLQDWEQQVESTQDKVDSLQDEISSLQLEITNEKADMESELQAIQTEAQNERSAAEKKVKEERRALEDWQEQAGQKVRELQAQITKADDQIREAERQKGEVQRALINQITDLELKCYTVAMTWVSEYRNQQLAQKQNSQLSAGGFNNLMSQVGLSSRQRSERLVETLAANCKKGKSFLKDSKVVFDFKAAKKMAEDAATSQLKQLDNVVATAKKTKEQIYDQIRQLQVDTTKKALERAKENMVEVQTDLDRKLDELNKKANTVLTSRSQAIGNKETQLGQKQMRLVEEQDFLSQRKSYLSLKRQNAPGGNNVEAGKVYDAMAKFDTMIVRAQAVVSSCNCCGASPGSGQCGNTTKFLSDHFAKVDENFCGDSGGGSSTGSSVRRTGSGTTN